MKNSKLLLHALVGASLVAGAAGAQALTMTLSNQIGGDFTSVVYPTGTYAGNGGGGFQGSLTGAGINSQANLLTYCVELDQDFTWGSYSNYTLETAASAFGSTKAGELANMLSWALGNSSTWFSDRDKSSGLQLAIWEVVYESVANPLSLGSGSFALNTSGTPTNAAAVGYASTLLAQATTVQANGVSAFVLASAQNQDQLFWENAGGHTQYTQNPAPVPEPASLALVAVALGGLAISRRRKPARSPG